MATNCRWFTGSEDAGIEGDANSKRQKKAAGRAHGSCPDAAQSAARTLDLEREGLQALRATLDQQLKEPFRVAVATLAAAKGRVIVTGIGKSGHVGQKIAATFASTGTPAFFVHPSEASHGDLGMITRDDVIVAISWSGESVELGNILTYSRRFKVPLIAITSRADSALAKQSDVVLELPRAKEACPHGLAPTTSTTMQLAIGDCLAIALLEAKGFTAHDFKVFHPGGSLGANLKFVADVMHSGDQLPLVTEGKVMSEAIVIMTQKSFGCLGVVDGKGRLVGMITDGDLRRHMGPELLKARVQDIMTKKPNTLSPDMLASAALEQINSLKRTQMFVVERASPSASCTCTTCCAPAWPDASVAEQVPGPRRRRRLRPLVPDHRERRGRWLRLGGDRLGGGLRLRRCLGRWPVIAGDKAGSRQPKRQPRLLRRLRRAARHRRHGLAVPHMGLVVSADREGPERRADGNEKQREQQPQSCHIGSLRRVSAQTVCAWRTPHNPRVTPECGGFWALPAERQPPMRPSSSSSFCSSARSDGARSGRARA